MQVLFMNYKGGCLLVQITQSLLFFKQWMPLEKTVQYVKYLATLSHKGLKL